MGRQGALDRKALIMIRWLALVSVLVPSQIATAQEKPDFSKQALPPLPPYMEGPARVGRFQIVINPADHNEYLLDTATGLVWEQAIDDKVNSYWQIMRRQD